MWYRVRLTFGQRSGDVTIWLMDVDGGNKTDQK